MDDETFTALVRDYTGYAYNIAYRILDNPADADDVVQDAFISAYRARDSFRGNAAVTTWLYRIVVNAALMKLRKNRHSPRTSGGVEDLDLKDWRPGPESETLNAELRSVLEDAIRQLPASLRTAVVLCDVQQLEIAEAAAIAEVTVSAFKARLHRACRSPRDASGVHPSSATLSRPSGLPRHREIAADSPVCRVSAPSRTYRANIAS